MKKRPNATFSYLLVILCILLTIGCSSSLGKVTAKDILQQDPDADIFMLNDTIYSNATDIEWIKENNYEKGSMIGEITKKVNTTSFKNGTSSKLPVGTKIYSTYGEEITSVVLVEVNGEYLYYLALIEG
ncbi:hypothetical protein ACWE42_15050 [Sutcliffiella cohnii]